MSLPVRERGLKQHAVVVLEAAVQSLPVRERGLKLADPSDAVAQGTVAPRAGAWIEAMNRSSLRHVLSVAPRAGAWIEASTLALLHITTRGRSPCGSVD